MKGDAWRRHYRWITAQSFRRCKELLIVTVFLLSTLQGFSAAALNTNSQKSSYREYAVKAAYLYNFAKFVEWPAEVFSDPSHPLSICIFGKDPFGDALDTIKDKSVKGRKLVIRQYSGADDLKECHIIYISPSEEKNLAGILEKIKGMHMLTVSDMEGFAGRGGMINLNREENRILLEINLDAAQRSGLKLSSKLLKLAKIIKGDK